ncbi:MAG: NADH-quinone oxidoreductase subunit M [Ignavibacteria bacterium]|nr:NADH-quinone oxidoreductase subunit M [Ignavibacteria bacterium]
MNILTLFLIVPVLTVIAILISRTKEQIRVSAAVGMGIQLIQSIYLIFAYLAERSRGNIDVMLFTKTWKWFESMNIQFSIGVDGISVSLIALTGIVIFTGVLTSWHVDYLTKEFFISLIVLSTGVFGFFISLDLFTMFLFFELAVIPMYLLIGIWGSGPKEYAAMKLTLMLMGASALLLVGILGLYVNSVQTGNPEFTFNIVDLSRIDLPIEVQRVFFPMVFVGFGVLGALFPFHTWSPDGHSSAPTAVSMLHAGVLMKMGGYGCLRVAMYLMPDAANEMGWIFIILTTISVVYGAFGAIVQKDLKYINAYSSVSHCGLVLFAILMSDKISSNGAVLQMISHGLMTALFFALIGMIYERTHTRDIRFMGGLMKVLPFLAVCYMIAGFASLGLPGLSGFIAEMNIFVGAFQHSETFYRVATVIVCSSIVITAVYILRVVAALLLGPIKNEEFNFLKDAVWFEKASTVILIIAIAGMGLAPLWLSELISESLNPIIQKLSLLNIY